MTKPIRFAIVGARGYARTLLAYIQRMNDEGKGQLVAATLRNRNAYPEIAAALEAKDVHIFDDCKTMLATCQDAVDIIVLPTAIHYHAPMTIAALEAEYAVFVEKPVAGCLADADQMIAARDASGKPCAVGFQLIYSPVIQTLKARIAGGTLGQVRRISTMALWPRNPTYYRRNEWAGKLYSDGQPIYDSPFNNALAHQIMNMLYLASSEMGSAAYPAQTEAELFRAYDIESFDTGCLRVRTDSDVEVIFAASHAGDVLIEPVMRVETENATALYQYDERATLTYPDGTTEIIEQDDARKHMFYNVIDVVTGTVSEPLCTLEIGRAHVACIEAMHRVAPIVTVPAKHVSVTAGGQRSIAGVQDALRQTFTTGELFSELGAPFAQTN